MNFEIKEQILNKIKEYSKIFFIIFKNYFIFFAGTPA